MWRISMQLWPLRNYLDLEVWNMENNTNPNAPRSHDSVWVTTPDGVDIQVDAGISELITLLWSHGIVTNYSCEGGPSQIKKKTHHLLGYISMPNNQVNRDFVLGLIGSDLLLNPEHNEDWVFEFDYFEAQGNRICMRFPNQDIPKFISYLRD